jgi:glucans biosynthesis protein C
MDNLRVTIIMLVIMLHLAVTYSSLGLWYYNERIVHGFYGQIFFSLFQTNFQGFSMGLMFFIAGFFTPGSFDRKGVARFLKDRIVRLGLPSLIYLLVITPFICWFELPERLLTGGATTFTGYYSYYLMSAGLHLLGMGPMWFAVALLIFSIIYAAVRFMMPRSDRGPYAISAGGTFRVLLLLVLCISAGAFLLRLVFPIGSIFWGMQLCYFSQYIILFIAGIYAWKSKFLDKISPRAGAALLIAGLAVGIIGLAALKLKAGIYVFSTHTINLAAYSRSFGGGITWTSIAFTIWESFVAVSMMAGLIALFRRKVNFSNKFTQALSDNSFAVYMFHPPIIIAVTLLMKNVLAGPVVKWAIAGVISVPACFLLAHYVLLRVPFLKRIL